jgi:hypothetical protein
LDDFVRATQYRRRNRHPKRFCRLEIDDELEPRGLSHRKVARPGAFEKPVDVARSVSELVKDAGTEAHQSTRLRKLAELGSYGHPVLVNSVFTAFSKKLTTMLLQVPNEIISLHAA